MDASWTRTLLILASLGLAVFGAVLLAWTADGDREAARKISEVRRPAVSGAPRAPERGGREAEMMEASYYGHELEGSPTASGEPFDPEGYTAAHKSLPLGTKLKISRGGESVRVTVNDRGPYVAGRDLDLSLAAAREIGLAGRAEASVRVTVL